jgi:hypothetical protein
MHGLWVRVKALLAGTAIVRVVSGGRRNLGKSLDLEMGLHCGEKKLPACSVAERLVVRESFDSAAERFVVREYFDSDAAEIQGFVAAVD